MASSTDTTSSLSPLKEFLSTRPHIHYADPSSADYDSLRAIYMIMDIRPSIIVRPQNADEVAGLISVLATHSIPFTIRTGGHDLFGRALLDDAVVIDMRDISYVEIDKGSLSARIGGGVIIDNLATELGQENLMTATGTIPVVGFAGWASHGGYGIFSPKCGLGADQILAAKVVNGEGKIIDADEKLLSGIRGGGGAFGVIVELTIRVYETSSVLGGMVLYDSKDIAATITQFNDAYRELYATGLPSPLGIHQVTVNTPNGKAFSVFFLWNSSDHETGRLWLDKICALAPLTMHTVAETAVADYLKLARTAVSDRTAGTIHSLTCRSLTPEFIEAFAANAEKMPPVQNTMTSLHEFRACPSTEASHPPSVFPQRQPHFMLEIFATGPTPETLDESHNWAKQLHQALIDADPENILPTRYLPFVPPEELDVKAIFQGQYERLVELKKEYDPQNVFKTASLRF